MTNQNKWKQLLPEGAVILIVFLMVWLAGAVHDKEIIFPEIAAIATGALLAPRYTWRVSKVRMFLLLLLCGVIGVGIVYFLPLSLAGQMMAAALCSQLIYLYSRTTFAPLVSAIVLPVLLQSRSVWYLISLILFTGIILGSSTLIEKQGVRPVNIYSKTDLPGKQDFVAALLRWIIMCIVIAVAIPLGFRFVAAPPLLVAFTEFCKPKTHVKHKELQFLALLTGCAVIGAGSRYLLTVLAGVPLYGSAVFAILLFFLVLRVTKIYLPPAGAMVLLAMLIPEKDLFGYPVQIMVGAAIYLFVSSWYAGRTQAH